MPNSVEKWRASSGSMDANTRSVYLGVMILLHSILVVHVLVMLLLLAGDVERNPGPVTGELILDRDHYKVCRYIKELEKKQHQELGGALGLHYTKLKGMDDLPADMIAAWLRAEDDVLDSGPPSWESLVKALREIGQAGIARKIVEGEKLETQAPIEEITKDKESTHSRSQQKTPQHSSSTSGPGPLSGNSSTPSRVESDTNDHKGDCKSDAKAAGPVCDLQQSRLQDVVKEKQHGARGHLTSGGKSSDKSAGPLKEQPIEMRLTKQRTVLILGKCGAGKTTVANKILREPKFKIGSGFTSKSNEYEAKCTLQNYGSDRYLVRVIDTIGLFDTRHGEAGSKDFKTFESALPKKAPEGINLILFVVKHLRWTEEEQKTFLAIGEKITEEASAMSALVVTGCESMSTAERRKVLEDFCELRNDVVKFMGKGLHIVGFPDLDYPEMLHALKAIYEEPVRKDQEAIRQLVYKSEKRVSSENIFKKKWYEIFM